MNNTNTTTSDKKVPDKIGGFKVDKTGIVSSEIWQKMSKDDRQQYWTAKNKLRDGGLVFPKKGEDSYSASSNSTKEKSQHRQIQKLQK